MFNLVVLIGNLGADPDIRTTPSGVKIAKMRLAVNDTWTNRQTGGREQRTNWVDLNAWDKLAQTAERYLTRGQRICVRGSLEYREWQAQDGGKRSKLEVRVRELYMLSPRDNQGGGNRGQGYSDYNQQRQAPAQTGYNQQQQQQQPPVDMSFQGNSMQVPLEDDDIPF